MSLSDKLRSTGADKVRIRSKSDPVWKGPEEAGITFSLLSRFLCCRERFRLRVVEGLKPADAFNHRIEYGQMWHTCEEALAKGNDPTRGGRADRASPLWEDALTKYVSDLCRRYPLAQEQIVHWYNVCKVQFPLYVDYWARHGDVTSRTPLLQEQVFDVPYYLPSRRMVRLRGKWDAVDLIGRHPSQGIYLQENKTKGDIDEQQLQRQLTFDLQTMMYLTALTWDTGIEKLEDVKKWDGKKLTTPILGVRYNVIRRPLSGGKGTIVRHKATKNHDEETKEHYYERLAEYIRDDPGYFFMRWKVEVSQGDVAKFRQQCLDPLLESLCAWWDWVREFQDQGPFAVLDMTNIYHWRHPFGVYNSLDEGGSSELDSYLETGSEVGLQRVETLFPELESSVASLV